MPTIVHLKWLHILRISAEEEAKINRKQNTTYIMVYFLSSKVELTAFYEETVRPVRKLWAFAPEETFEPISNSIDWKLSAVAHMIFFLSHLTASTSEHEVLFSWVDLSDELIHSKFEEMSWFERGSGVNLKKKSRIWKLPSNRRFRETEARRETSRISIGVREKLLLSESNFADSNAVSPYFPMPTCLKWKDDRGTPRESEDEKSSRNT